MAMKRCGGCGLDVSTSARKCPHCGASQSIFAKKCPECLQTLRLRNGACSNCGTQFESIVGFTTKKQSCFDKALGCLVIVVALFVWLIYRNMPDHPRPSEVAPVTSASGR